MTGNPLTIVAFGDSITAANEVPLPQRWPSLLEQRLAERAGKSRPVVINAGVGGNTSREGLARMDKDVIAHRPAIVLVEFGGNDTTDEPTRTVPLEEFRANLAAMKSKLDTLGGATMILLTFPPVVNENHSYRDREKYRVAGGPDGVIEPYREATRDFARHHRLSLADIDLAVRANLADHVLPDGVHLTESGNRAVADAVFPVVAAC